MKTYRVTCRGVKETFTTQVKGADHQITDLRNSALLSIFEDDEKEVPVANFNDWIYFTIE